MIERSICPILARELERQLEEVPSRESFRSSRIEERVLTADSDESSSTRFSKWGKTFQNMRSSYGNDWVVQGIPAHVGLAVRSVGQGSRGLLLACYLRYYKQIDGLKDYTFFGPSICRFF